MTPKELQSIIVKALKQFNEENNVIVTEIDLKCTDLSTMRDTNPIVYYTVKIKFQ